MCLSNTQQAAAKVSQLHAGVGSNPTGMGKVSEFSCNRPDVLNQNVESDTHTDLMEVWYLTVWSTNDHIPTFLSWFSFVNTFLQ